MEQHLGIGILMQDIAETFEEWKNRHLCNLKKNSNLYKIFWEKLDLSEKFDIIER